MTEAPRRLSRSFPIVLSGPSGVGKSTVVGRLLEQDPDVDLSISVTTREQRAGEVSGREYEFVGHDEFIRRRDAGEFIEWAEVHGHLYGTPRGALEDMLRRGHDVLLDVDYQGGLAIKRSIPETLTIFILPPSFSGLETRLRGRGSDDEEQIARRLEVASREMAQAVHYDAVVINEDMGLTYEQVQAVIIGERQRTSRINPKLLEEIAGPPAAAGATEPGSPDAGSGHAGP